MAEEPELREIVTCFLRHGRQICLFKRSQLVGSSRGKWHGVSGHLPAGVPPLTQALQEIGEETGLNSPQVRLVRAGAPVEVPDTIYRRVWRIYPFLFETTTTEVRLDWEHETYCWIDPTELGRFDTVRGLVDLYHGLIGEQGL
ncbi:MAG: NUDIX domain-containing protein [Chloroflexi bacterium]|nr:NUDIX domain-containing protein [Chloroflexota bacterium]